MNTLTNDTIFKIGIFPYFMMMASTVFFPAGWVRDFAGMFRIKNIRKGGFIIGAGIAISIFTGAMREHPEVIPLAISFVGGGILAWTFLDLLKSFRNGESMLPASNSPNSLSSFQKAVITGIVLWVIIQISIPLRHYFIPGNVNWTEEGHRFSWHMKLRDKSAKAIFYAYDPQSGDRFEIDYKKILKSWQRNKMRTRPYLIQQFAEYLDKQMKLKYNRDFEIRADVKCALNFRPYEILIDPQADLSSVTYSDMRHNRWITLPELIPISALPGKTDEDDEPSED